MQFAMLNNIKEIIKKSDSLIKLRLGVFSLYYILLIFLSLQLLRLDYTTAEDPRIWFYQTAKWKLITCWFHLIYLVYIPICLYCDWSQLKRRASRHLRWLDQLRYWCFTAILFPSTLFSDILFWQLWNKDINLITVPAVNDFVPKWYQHCLHTISLVMMVFDLICLPRRRPKSFVPGITILVVYITSYILVCYISLCRGEYLYPLLKMFNSSKLFVLCLYVYISHIFYYTIQWFVIDSIWSANQKFTSHNKIY